VKPLASAAGLLLVATHAATLAATSSPTPAEASAAAGSRPLLDPLYVKNLAPVAGLLGLPSQRSADTGEAGQWQWALQGSLASHYVADGARRERIILDGETQRLALLGRYAFADGWEVQLELPWQRQDGGVLDTVIDHWHDFWGMPDNGRGEARRDALDYRYADPQLRFDLRQGSDGWGDTSLSLQHRLYRGAGVEAALALGYKFGSGEPAQFTGSGEDDAFATLRLSGQWGPSLAWHGQFGYLHAGRIPGLEARQERDLWFAGGALAWQLAPRWSLIGQLDAHAAPLDSDLDGLGRDAILLTGGARWAFAGDWALELSLVEDVAVETGPDVIFQAGLQYYGR
jgi:Protein of unknown function (DUF3187)